MPSNRVRPNYSLPQSFAIESLERRVFLSASAVASTIANVIAPIPTVATQRQMEFLDRGMIAIRTSSNATGNIYVGWRLLGTDPASIGFNLYCSTNGGAAVKISGASPLTTSTNFVHTSQTYSQSHRYFVRPVIGGVEQADSESFTLAANAAQQHYVNVPIQAPAGGTLPGVPTAEDPNPAPHNYTYTANDASVGDLDGDGDYEIILKWDPTDSKDNSQAGFTGNVYIDAIDFDKQGNSTLLWRIDLGKNIRAGAHYTQFIVYDLDGDGRAEVAMKTAPGTIDGLGNHVLLNGDNPNADYRNGSGYILTGPEYLTVFNGLTGANRATIPFEPARGATSQWGDSYGNRVDRFTASVAYLDGQRPSLIMGRGYYGPQSGFSSRNEIAAYNFRDDSLSMVWHFKAGLNINNNINVNYVGQGPHGMSVADVDFDGKDEIIYGAAAINDNGTGLYSTGLGHGDAFHVGDLDPTRPGLEVFMAHEDPGSYGGAGGEFRDAATGALLWGIPANNDVGRGNSFDIDPNYPGNESWATTNDPNGGGRFIYSAAGNPIYPTPSNMFYNFGIWWDADPLRELLDGTTISDWNYTAVGRSNLVSSTTGSAGSFNNSSGLSSNNSTKSTPALTADLFGDWREEVIWRRSDNTALQIWTTTIASDFRMYTLMHDLQYREAIAWQNGAYNQPPHPSFFLGAADASGAFPVIPTANIYTVKYNAVPPAAPTNPIATPISSGRIDLTWTAVPNVDSYIVKRSTTLGGPYTPIASNVLVPSYSDTTAVGPATYYYVISAFDEGLDGADSIEANATIPSPVSLQAEDASFGGGSFAEAINGGFNGSGYVNFPTTGGFLQFDNFNGGAGGTQNIRFRFALGNTARTGVLIVNGVPQSITFGNTGSFTTWQTLAVSVNLNAGPTNTIRLESTGQDLANLDEIQRDVGLVVDNTPPQIVNSQFDYIASPPRMILTLSENVSPSFTAGDVSIEQIGVGPVSLIGFGFDPNTLLTQIYIDGGMPDGNYRITINSNGVFDTAGNPLTGPTTFDFFLLAGDANHDRAVNIYDLRALAANWLGSGKNYSQGDFNGSGTVDTIDLQILSRQWQKTQDAPLLSPMPASLTSRRPATRNARLIDQIGLE